MNTLHHKHLMTLDLTVDFPGITMIGETPAGLRRIAPVSTGHFSGERLNGTVLPGFDWVINRPDGVMVLDVRLTLKTDDDAMIYLDYQGRFLADPDVMVRLAKGETLSQLEYSLVINAKFECGEDNYKWLNNVIAVGTGEQTANGPVYSIFEIG